MSSTTTPRYEVVLLDLDRTVIDSLPGVAISVRHGLEAIGFTGVTDEVIMKFMGPPLKDVLVDHYGRPESDIDSFFTAYKEKYFDDAEYDFELYPGLAQLIADLNAAGVTLILATAKPDPRRDSCRMTEGELVEHNDRESVDLADALTRCVDQNRPLPDLFKGAGSYPFGAPVLGIDRLLDISGGDRLQVLPGRPIVCLTEEIGERHRVGREPFGIASHARTLLDDAGNGCPIEWQEPLLPCD
jgi:hypothetical protein